MAGRERMASMDAAWLQMEEPANLMMITAVLWFDGAVDLSRLREVVRERLVERYPRFRQRVVPGTLGAPYWEDAPDFDLDEHLSTLRVPASAGREGLEALVGDWLGVPLERTCPLWQLHLVRGAERGDVLLARLHHCMADGIALARVLLSLTDPVEGGASRVLEPGAAPARSPSRVAVPEPASESAGSPSQVAVPAPALESAGSTSRVAMPAPASEAAEGSSRVAVPAPALESAESPSRVAVPAPASEAAEGSSRVAVPAPASEAAEGSSRVAAPAPASDAHAKHSSRVHGLGPAQETEPFAGVLRARMSTPGQETEPSEVASRAATSTPMSGRALQPPREDVADGRDLEEGAGGAGPASLPRRTAVPSWLRLARGARAALHRGAELVREPILAGDLVREGARGAAALGKLLVMPPDPRSPLRGPLNIRKVAAWSEAIPLERVKAVGRALGGTVNDVLLTAVTGALRRYLHQHDAPLEDVHALVPVNLRPLDAPIPRELGNRFGVVFLRLPVHLEEPRRRLREVSKRMEALKRSPEAVVTSGALELLGRTPAALERIAVDVMGSKASLVATNVPGPRQPVSLAGTRLDGLTFWVPQAGHVGLGVSLFSYAGQVTVGVASDASRVPDPGALVAAFQEELDALATTAP
jgi:hypothetical protein